VICLYLRGVEPACDVRYIAYFRPFFSDRSSELARITFGEIFNPRKENQMRGLESIQKLNALLVDVDVRKQAREEGLAPEPVKSEAEEVARDVVDRMEQLGFQPALLIDSGNGFHVYAKVDMRLPLFGNKEEWKETVLHRKLERLESELEPCETEEIEIDNLTKDVVRRVKIPGTWNVKDGMSEGDYRRAEIIEEYDYD